MENKDPQVTEFCKLWIKDNIIHTEFSQDLYVTFEIANEIVNQRIKYAEGGTYKGIVDITNIRKVDPRARNYWASEESYSCISKLAIFSHDRFSKILANFWLKFDRPYRPTKFFTNKEHAYQYLAEKSVE